MEKKSTIVWDRLVRFGHWALVFLFAVSWISSELNTDVHTWSGYCLASLVLIRVGWGFVGSPHARFADFVRPPAEVLAYTSGLIKGQPTHFEGHNPLGGWMVVALLASLLMTAGTGMTVYGAEGHGPLAGFASMSQASSSLPEAVTVHSADEDDEYGERRGHDDREHGEQERASAASLLGLDEDVWEDIHEALANTTLFLIFLHVVGVLVASLIHGENLIAAMVSGRKS